MAQALYDYWFVQFDFPDENGKPYKSSGGKMVWNEELKREIPEGWEVKPLCSWLEIKSGFPFKSSSYQPFGKYGIITIKNVQEGNLDLTNLDYIDELPSGMKDWCKLKKGDRLISLTGNCGRLCVVTSDNLLLNQRVGLLSCAKTNLNYAYYLLRSSLFQNICNNLANGAAQANLSPIELCKCLAILPPQQQLNRFDEIISVLMLQQVNGKEEMMNLTKQRDFLLPLLMNGQVQVKPLNYRLYPLLVACCCSAGKIPRP